MTDSQTVFGWQNALFHNTQRVKVSGLHEMVVKRRLQVISGTIDASGLSFAVEWVPARVNVADKLTRVPEKYLAVWKAKRHAGPDLAVATPAGEPETHVSLFRPEDISTQQSNGPAISEVVEALEAGKNWEIHAFKKVRTQLSGVDGLLAKECEAAAA